MTNEEFKDQIMRAVHRMTFLMNSFSQLHDTMPRSVKNCLRHYEMYDRFIKRFIAKHRNENNER